MMVQPARVANDCPFKDDALGQSQALSSETSKEAEHLLPEVLGERSGSAKQKASADTVHFRHFRLKHAFRRVARAPMRQSQ